MNGGTRPTAFTLGDTIARAARAGHEGDVLLRDEVGRVHRVTLRAGNVIAVRLAGRFNPLLEQLYRNGAVDEAGVVAVLEALGRSERRVGELAIAIAGARPEDVREALAEQLHARIQELFVVAETSATPSLAARAVLPSEGAGALPWREVVRGTLRGRDLRAAQSTWQRTWQSAQQSSWQGAQQSSWQGARDGERQSTWDGAAPRVTTHSMPSSRAELRRLAKHCHPDLTRHLPAAEQAARAAQLARATAAFHGLC